MLDLGLRHLEAEASMLKLVSPPAQILLALLLPLFFSGCKKSTASRHETAVANGDGAVHRNLIQHLADRRG